MKFPSLIIFIALLACLPNKAYAHAIWIETNTKGEIGKQHVINIYYGEYADNLREATAGRFGEVSDFTVWLVSSDNKRTKLVCAPSVNSYSTSFIPMEPGVYHVVVENQQREVMDWSKYDIGVVKPNYYATAEIVINDQGRTSGQPSPNSLTSFHIDRLNTSQPQTGQEEQFKVYFKDLPAAKQKLIVFAPNGWSREIETDANGIAVFFPLWPGQHVIESLKNEKQPGSFKDVSYAAIRHRATYVVQVEAIND